LNPLLQIVPKVPGGIDGVGDYALTISKKLREKFGCDTVFAAFGASTETAEGFPVMPLELLPEQTIPNLGHVLLHYVNYGFQKRGVPFRLLSVLKSLRAKHRGKLVTVFHELYASGPPWQSAFWLKPLQIRLAKSVALLSDVCIVSSDNFRRELKQIVPGVPLQLHPVSSWLGEPSLSSDQIANRDPHQWLVVGGSVLVQRSLRSLHRLISRTPDSIAPRRLFVIGGDKNPITESLIVDLGIESIYRPRITAADASEILRTCSFASFDYFHRPDVETSVVLKSSAFAALCAHAVIPIFPHSGSPISLDGDQLPGPFFIAQERSEIPDPGSRGKIAVEIYDWYQRHASSEILVRGIAKALELVGAQ
jgi:hypothetical protein